MLNPEQANARLQALRIQDWKEQRLKSIANLPHALRQIGWGILGRDCDGQPFTDYQAGYNAEYAAFKQLDDLNAESRQTLFATLFPQIATHVEQAWQLIIRLPYQSSYARRAFRAPNTPKITQSRRGDWLRSLLYVVEGYEQDLRWFAAWSAYFGSYVGDTLGILFAAAIDAGGEAGEEIFEILLASARGEHEIGAMGRHVTRGLLVASRADGWAFVENLLLAAQRQEGLRQTILETIDEAHPEAFRRMLRLIVDHDLTRFSAVVRAVDVWFGFGWESVNNRVVKEVLGEVLQFLEYPEVREEVLGSYEPPRRQERRENEHAQRVYLALWTLAFEDAVAAIAVISRFLEHPDVEYRFVAVRLLAQLGLVEAQVALLPALEDEDLRVVTCALMVVQGGVDKRLQETDLFERLERILPRFPKQVTVLQPLVWDWIRLEAQQQTVANALVGNLGDRSPKRLIPYLSFLDASNRSYVATKLAEVKPWDDEIRNILFSLVGDASSWVRERVLQALAICTITAYEATQFERLLSRKSGDLRRGILQLLINQLDEEAIASAQRLLAAGDANQRVAGLELLRQMMIKERAVSRCQVCVQEYQLQPKKRTSAETELLEVVLNTNSAVPTLEDALGLIDLKQLTPRIPPQVQKPRLFVTPAAIACLKSLDDLIHEHRQMVVTIETWQGSREELLGNVGWNFPAPDGKKSLEEDVTSLPLRELWETWWSERPKELRDADNLELLRILPGLWGSFGYEDYAFQEMLWWQEVLKTVYVDSEVCAQLRYADIISKVCQWLIRLFPQAETVNFLLDAVATSFTLIPESEFTQVQQNPHNDWRNSDALFRWLNIAKYHQSLCPEQWNDTDQLRLWQLLHWLDQPSPQVLRKRPKLQEVLQAFRLGAATVADLIDQLLTTPSPLEYSFEDLRRVSARKLPADLAAYPILKQVGDRCRQRIIEVELKRGDLPTAASHPALALRSVEGVHTLVRLLQAFGKQTFVRGYTYDNLSKANILSHLIRVSFPLEFDTPQEFAQQVKAAKIPIEKLIELAFYAPQWVNYVETALHWSSFAEAVWWFHAHTKDNNWHVDQEIRETWTAQVSERTPLSGQNLVDGAVDVDWFARIYKALGKEKWQILDKAAKYASGGGGHKRAQLFANAMLGSLEKAALVTSITSKRHQDSLRSLGLLPLAKGKKRNSDLLERYKIIQEFLRTSRKFGSQKQASEKLAASIAMENLARTAGYPDPQRLEWAMEAQAVADLAASPITVALDEVSVSLAITDKGEAQITVTKQGKPLKSVPAKAKKDPKIVELQARKQEITRQASRMRLSLEQAMCRGDTFTKEELQQLYSHPVLAPMLTQLIFIGEEEAEVGYPVQQGESLQLHNGNIFPIASAHVRIAHSYDLLQTQEWHLWQQECFNKERTQPFKQVFRELYVLTSAEKAEETISRRYAGHQINPRQALALFGGRGWVTHPEEGVRRTFHELGIAAWVTFVNGFFSPTEVEGLTLEGVRFSKRGEWKPLPLEEIPPQIFSEVMRDLDLVVSVAHQGGVDPEASASTVEMRTSLIRETCRLLKLTNVKLQSSHALIEGHLGSYLVHLGSAVVHRQPGGALCIVPVHSQHRGRLFLPFADDDPKTAEVVSKVLLLARDKEIQDPTILSQIFA
ncbi:hypothetical protein NIES4073_73380 [Kalymmatonema gypsitolerans NIES-4073]|nr:hypothetical protein NIES4073_73380 [Scytonema sp. NIES-4073]